jgi:hypothetical protein
MTGPAPLPKSAHRPPLRELAANCTTAAECWKKLLDDRRLDLACWWLALDGGWSAVEPLMRRWVLRALRSGAALVDADAARVLHEITDGASWPELAAGLRALDSVRDLALALALALNLDRDLNLDLDLDLARSLALAIALNLDRDLALNLDRDLDLALALNLDRDLDRDLDLDRNRNLALALALARDLDRALDLDRPIDSTSARARQAEDIRDICRCPWTESGEEI